MISSSIVWQDPPFFTILARADSEKRRAATLSLGISRILESSVTVPTTTTVLSVFFPRCLTSLLRETGGLWVLEATSLLRTVLQNLESVLLERNLKSCEGHKAINTPEVGTYSHEEMLIKILAFGVLLGLLLNSASFIQVDTLKESRES